MRPNEYQQVELMLYLILSLVGFLPKQNTDSSPFTRLGESHDSRFRNLLRDERTPTSLRWALFRIRKLALLMLALMRMRNAR